MHTKDMNEGVQILLARMKTHPEEFISSDKWMFLHDALKENRLSFLDSEEVAALDNGLKELYRQKFTAKILAKLTESVQGELF